MKDTDFTRIISLMALQILFINSESPIKPMAFFVVSLVMGLAWNHAEKRQGK